MAARMGRFTDQLNPAQSCQRLIALHLYARDNILLHKAMGG